MSYGVVMMDGIWGGHVGGNKGRSCWMEHGEGMFGGKWGGGSRLNSDRRSELHNSELD